ncbi:MAG: hypothetical protein MJZ14_07200 [Paludibacteraceae bacterium]|nr:hypothetical protein [Paludibacteraceae bacterium]
MNTRSFTFILLGSLVLSLSQVSAALKLDLPQPSEEESTVLKDGFRGPVKTVRIYGTRMVGDRLEKGLLRSSFRYDGKGNRIECYNASTHLIYKKGYNRQGHLVRSSVQCDTMSERMRDTLFVYDSRGLLTEKRIYSWGEHIETERFNYNERGKLEFRNLISETDKGKSKEMETVLYNASGEELSHVMFGPNMDTLSQVVNHYHPTTGKLERSLEMSNGLPLHDYHYTYDANGLLTKKQDNGRLGRYAHYTLYEYDGKNRVKRERLFRIDNFCVSDNSLRYYSDGTIKKCEHLRETPSKGKDAKVKGDWDLMETHYNRNGLVKKYKHYIGSGVSYIKQDYETYAVLANDEVVQLSLDEMEMSEDDEKTLFYDGKEIVDVQVIMSQRKIAKRTPAEVGAYRYRGNTIKHREVKNGYGSEEDKNRLDGYGRIKSSRLFRNYSVCLKSTFDYDYYHNLTEVKYFDSRYLSGGMEYYTAYDADSDSFYSLYSPSNKKEYFLVGGVIVEYEYWN